MKKLKYILIFSYSVCIGQVDKYYTLIGMMSKSSTLNDSLMAAYNADGNPYDFTTHYNGTLTNGATAAGSPKIGSASFTFDGIDDYVALPVNTFTFTSSFSVSAWYYAVDVYDCVIFSTQDGVNGGFRIGEGANGIGWIRVFYGGGSFFDLNSPTSVIPNAWTHLVIVHKAGVGTYMYVNGTLDCSVLNGLTVASSGVNFPTIGIDEYGSGSYVYPFKGRIDAVQVWNKPLTATEITSLYNSGSGKQPPF